MIFGLPWVKSARLPSTCWKAEAMNHTEADYINTGAAYERASNPDKARAVAQRLRAMLSSERPEDQTYARADRERPRRCS